MLQTNLKVGAADPVALVRSVRDDHVDVLLTEELTTSERARLLAAGLARTLPHRYDAALPDGGGGLAIWSRYPLSEERNLPKFRLGVLSANVRLPGGRQATIVSVHLLPPYPYAPEEWAAECVRLRRFLRRLPGIVVVGGDFNATTDNARFRRLLGHGYADATEHAGEGYLPTYPTDRITGPLIAIDHVLTRGADAIDVRTVTLPRSDHRGLLAHVRLRSGVGTSAAGE